MSEIEFYKKTPNIQVYRDLGRPERIIKKYTIDPDEEEDMTREDLLAIRKKL